MYKSQNLILTLHFLYIDLAQYFQRTLFGLSETSGILRSITREERSFLS